jgi:hypothetical protein
LRVSRLIGKPREGVDDAINADTWPAASPFGETG